MLVVKKKLTFWRVVFAERVRSRAGLLTKALLLAALLAAQYVFGGFVERLGLPTKLLTIFLYYVGLSAAFSFVRVLVIKQYLARNGLSANHVDNFTLAIKRLSTATMHFVFFFVLLWLLQIPIAQFFTSISIFLAALVLMTRDYIVGFFNGLSLLFTDRFSVDDYIKVGDYKGRIRDVRFQSIELLTDQGDVVYVPTSALLTKEVANFSKNKTKTVSEEVMLPVLSNKRLEKLAGAIRSSLKELGVPEDSVAVRVAKLDKETVTVRVEVRVREYRFEREQAIRERVYEQALLLRNRRN